MDNGVALSQEDPRDKLGHQAKHGILTEYLYVRPCTFVPCSWGRASPMPSPENRENASACSVSVDDLFAIVPVAEHNNTLLMPPGLPPSVHFEYLLFAR